eukprot:m.119663 g.119663  ORF g.119663 m.119663 type:complete len:302 (+) comp16158_c0_seq3:1777-2682(+)
MRKRQVANVDVVLTEARDAVAETRDGSDHVAVGDDHTLGAASGARGVHDDGSVLALGIRQWHRAVLPTGLHVLEAADCQTVERLRHAIVLLHGIVEKHNIAHVLDGAGLEESHNLADEAGLCDDAGALGLNEGLGQSLVAQAGVHSDERQLLGEAGLRRNLPLGLGLGEDGHVLALAVQEFDQAASDIIHALLDLGEGLPLEVAALLAAHFLSIHNLDLLADDGAGAKALVVGEALGRLGKGLIQRGAAGNLRVQLVKSLRNAPVAFRRLLGLGRRLPDLVHGNPAGQGQHGHPEDGEQHA